MENWLFISVFILLCPVWLWIQYSASNSSHELNSPAPAKRHSMKYHSVSVHPCSHSCESIRKVKKRRFLSREAPTLPIFGCTNQECTCTYTHYNDRRHRDGYDRRFISGFPENERRTKLDRRYQSDI